MLAGACAATSTCVITNPHSPLSHSYPVNPLALISSRPPVDGGELVVDGGALLVDGGALLVEGGTLVVEDGALLVDGGGLDPVPHGP